MQLAFEQDDASRRIRGVFRIAPQFQGGTGFVHGGIVATLLDEVMAKVSGFEKEYAVTGSLNIEYLKPVPIGEELSVEGWQTGRHGRVRMRQGEIRSSSGVLLARGTGKFVEVDPEKFRTKVTEGAGQQS